MKRAIIDIDCRDSAILRETLIPEAGRSVPRTSVEIEEKGEVLQLRIEASDATALRAALNSYLRWVAVGIETSALLDKK